MLDYVKQFSQIARPHMFHYNLQSFLRENFLRDIHRHAVVLQDFKSQKFEVVIIFGQRWNTDNVTPQDLNNLGRTDVTGDVVLYINAGRADDYAVELRFVGIYFKSFVRKSAISS